MNKKGQVTIFIIVAIIIVVIGVSFFIFKDSLVNSNKVSSEIAPIKNFVDDCIEKTGEKVIYEVGQKGGYYLAPEKSTITGIPYYYLEGEFLMPSNEEIEKEISFFVKENLFFCTKNFVDFKDYNISQKEIKVETTILNNKIKLEIDYPLRIAKGKESFIIKDFEKEIPVRFGLVYDSILEYGICLNCLEDISEENDFYIEMFDYEQNTIIVNFIDKNSIINGEEFEYVYAIQS
jgi:hypothetical protein